MKKIEQFQITSLMLSGFKSYEEPTELVFGNPTVITGGNGRGKAALQTPSPLPLPAVPSLESVELTACTMRITPMLPFGCALWTKQVRSMSSIAPAGKTA
ncbi:MAG: hypothetical protein ACLRSD_17500 [Oscillibacter sp.]